MADTSLLIAISAFSGLGGALITQTLTGIFGYASDKRKYVNEDNKLFKAKKTEIGENFYYMTGEKMAIIHKNITHWKNWNNARSGASLDFLSNELVKLNSYMEKIDSENWKFNLIGLYFNVSLTNEKVIESNSKSKQLYLKVLDLSHSIKTNKEIDKESVYEQHAIAVFDMCSHYQYLFDNMRLDMELIRTELLEEYGVKSLKLDY